MELGVEIVTECQRRLTVSEAFVYHDFEFQHFEETEPGQITFRLIILMFFSRYPGAALVNHSEFRLSEETEPG
ncbi:hypothetical protein J6590_010944 [Homalodisca vitripennis]|nr:hypothetical protein J6590_010944 [Homalodisca vitripennis]